MSIKTFLRIGIAILVLAMIVAGGSYSRASLERAKFPCLRNLRNIHFAKAQWADDHRGEAKARPNWDDLAPYFRPNPLPRCPDGGVYTLGDLDREPACSIGGTGHTFR
jgi:hypothetical protein